MHEYYGMPTDLTTGELLQLGIQRLRAASESPELDAELLLAQVLNVHRSRLKSHPEEMWADQERARYLGLVDRRTQGEPLSYLTGRREFWSLRLFVDRSVLVPRPETELLVERSLALRGDLPTRVADLGTGSGAIALALACERPHWRIVATDVSEQALHTARRNATELKIETVEFRQGSWFEALADQHFDLLLSNPPYVAQDDPALAQPPLMFEPRIALTPGSEALGSLREIIRKAPEHLEREGWLLLEHGAAQAAEVARALVARGFAHVRSHRDLAGHERVTEARWH
jgi:release factor glutamine methyltransferase